MTEYQCEKGHEFAAPTRPSVCPSMVAGKVCTAAFVSGYYRGDGGWVVHGKQR